MLQVLLREYIGGVVSVSSSISGSGVVALVVVVVVVPVVVVPVLVVPVLIVPVFIAPVIHDTVAIVLHALPSRS